MKKEMIIVITAGIALTGLAVFLFGTESGKKLRQNIGLKEKDLTSKIEGLVRTGKEKFDSLKAEVLKQCEEKEAVA